MDGAVGRKKRKKMRKKKKKKKITNIVGTKDLVPVGVTDRYYISL